MWLKLDDGFADHPKVCGLSHTAFRTHVQGMLYSSRHTHDGTIPSSMGRKLSFEDSDIPELVKAKLWVPIESGWKVHDFNEYNPTEEGIEKISEERRLASVRGNHARWHGEAPNPDCPLCSGESQNSQEGSVEESQTDRNWDPKAIAKVSPSSSSSSSSYSRPSTRPKNTLVPDEPGRVSVLDSSDGGNPEYSPDFLRFWTAYPRKAKKGDAAKAWRKVKPPLEAVLAALAWQRKSPGWQAEGGKYIPHPATYLNAKCWQDERSGYEAGESAVNGVVKGPGPLPIWRDPVMEQIERERKAGKA